MELKIDKYRLPKVLIIMASIIFLFNGGLGAGEGTYLFSLDIKYAFVIITFLEIAALILVSFINMEFKIDSIFIVLFIKILLFTVILLYNNDSLNNLKTYLAVIEGLAIYATLLAIPTKNNLKFVLKLMEAYLVIICAQTLIITLSLNLSGVEYWRIKNYVQIPIGGSNFIASNIIMLSGFIICSESNKGKRNFLIVLSLISMFFTRSKSALIILICLYISEFFSFKNIKRDKKKIIMGIFIIGLLYISIITLKDIFPDFFDTYERMYTNLLSGSEEGTEAAFNGRFDLYRDSIELIKNNFLFGVGLNYSSVLDSLAHNFILDAFLRAGVFNVIITFLYLGISGYCSYKYKDKDDTIRGMGKMLFFVLIHGLFEPNLGGFIFEFPFWIIIGIGMKKYYEIRSLELIRN